MKSPDPITCPALARPLALTSLLLLVLAAPAAAQTKRALFDNAHAQTAGNADWQIDTDQPVPLPDQGGIGPATPRTYWLGGISSWAVDLVKRGYTVATNTGVIAYGNPANPYDLSNWDVFIVPEPNTKFSSAESTAIFNFVRDGGGLVVGANHAGSDRNSDGWDPPRIWNALDPQQLWGVRFMTQADANFNVVQDAGNIANAPTDSVLHGPVGTADSISYHNGSSMMLYPSRNPRVRGLIWMNGVPQDTTRLLAARSEYGKGRLVFVGDSSPMDDGSATPGNSSIYDGWAEVSGRDSIFFLNATMWATRKPEVVADTEAPSVGVMSPAGGEQWETASLQTITWLASDNIAVDHVDVDVSLHGPDGPWEVVAHGVRGASSVPWTAPAETTDSALVRVRAFDAASNQSEAASPGLFQLVRTVGVRDDAFRPSFAAPWPNPASGRVHLAFTLPARARVRLSVLDVQGRRVRTLATGPHGAGAHAYEWDGRDEHGSPAAAGLHFAELEAGGRRVVRRMVRIE